MAKVLWDSLAPLFLIYGSSTHSMLKGVYRSHTPFQIDPKFLVLITELIMYNWTDTVQKVWKITQKSIKRALSAWKQGIVCIENYAETN